MRRECSTGNSSRKAGESTSVDQVDERNYPYSNNTDLRSADEHEDQGRIFLSRKPKGLSNKIKTRGMKLNLPTEQNQNMMNQVQEEHNKLNDADEKDVDCGYAWIILIVMFMINASTYGTARAYGLIFERLAREGSETRTNAALPFTIMGTVENMAGPLAGYLLVRLRSWRATMFIGSSLITLSHLLAAIFDSQFGQIFSIGLMCGTGLSLVTISSFQINNAYFVRYRSRAFGLGLTGAVIGTFYISPICQYILNYHSINLCFTTLGLILFPNVPLSLLLLPKSSSKGKLEQIDSHGKPTQASPTCKSSNSPSSKTPIVDMLIAHSAPPIVTEAMVLANQAGILDGSNCIWQAKSMDTKEVKTVSGSVSERQRQEREAASELSVWSGVSLILRTPLFHLIWPTQLLFCWLNFVYGMILVDFGHDRELENYQIVQLIPIWAFGQLAGRIGLGALVDLRFVSYKHLTVICFFMIGSATWLLNNVEPEPHRGAWMLILVFILSMFIANLYILFNGLVFLYMDKSLTALSIGISSFMGSFFLLPRANVIGYYRDSNGNYDSMLDLFTYVTLSAAAIWLIVPFLCDHFHFKSSESSFHLHLEKEVSTSRAGS